MKKSDIKINDDLVKIFKYHIMYEYCTAALVKSQFVCIYNFYLKSWYPMCNYNEE